MVEGAPRVRPRQARGDVRRGGTATRANVVVPGRVDVGRGVKAVPGRGRTQGEAASAEGALWRREPNRCGACAGEEVGRHRGRCLL